MNFRFSNIWISFFEIKPQAICSFNVSRLCSWIFYLDFYVYIHEIGLQFLFVCAISVKYWYQLYTGFLVFFFDPHVSPVEIQLTRGKDKRSPPLPQAMQFGLRHWGDGRGRHTRGAGDEPRPGKTTFVTWCLPCAPALLKEHLEIFFLYGCSETTEILKWSAL